MRHTSHRTLAVAVLCAIGGLFLKATEPGPSAAPSRQVPRAGARLGVRRVAPTAPLPREHAARAWAVRAPSLADGFVPVRQETGPAAVRETVRDAPPPSPPAAPGFRLLAGVAYRVPARDEDGGSPPSTTRPVLERERRGKRRRVAGRGRGAADRSPNAAPRDRRPGDTTAAEPEAPTPALPTTPGAVAPEPTTPVETAAEPAGAAGSGAPPADDVAFRSGDAEQFPTDSRIAIPIPAGGRDGGGTVSLWVQPGWERDNDDDATLVQIGDQVRLSKDHRWLRLETAGNDRDFGFSIRDWNPGEWHHVVAAWQEHALSLYVDGELVGRETDRRHVDLPSRTDLLLGSDRGDGARVARGLIGRIDVRSRSLGDDEVRRDYRDVVEGRGSGDRDRGPQAVPSTRVSVASNTRSTRGR